MRPGIPLIPAAPLALALLITAGAAAADAPSRPPTPTFAAAPPAAQPDAPRVAQPAPARKTPPAPAATSPARVPATGALAPSYATDRIELQLRPHAARAARAMRAAEAARRGLAPPSAAATAAPDVAVSSIGDVAIDRAVAELGPARFEPEFRGELPPPEGSEVTDFTAFYVVRWTTNVPAERAVARLRALPEVASADRIPLLPVAAFPNDSLFTRSWWYYDAPLRHDIHAPEAWDVTRGDSTIVVGVLDTGVLPYHPDLGGTVAGHAGQIYTNPIEAAGIPGVDDDGNGFIDDTHGWDFVNRPPDGVLAGEDYADQDNDPNDMAGHGTAVAGVIGALSDNGIGVTGTAWNVRLLPLRIGWAADGAPLGLVDMSSVAQAIRYATRLGASVLNCSFATLNLSGLYAAASAATHAGVTIVAAAGNEGQPHDLADRSDVIAVAATARGDVVAGFSNLGAFVDLAAPGDSILTTFVASIGPDSVSLRQPAYVSIDGTSFSAPMVSGAAALIQAQQRARGERPLIPQGMLLRLTETADDISAENPGVTGYGAGRLDLKRALTDRPTSTATRTAGATIGPAVVLPPAGPLERVAYLTSGPGLLVMAGQSADTLGRLDLPSFPLGQLAGGFAWRAAPVPARAAPGRAAPAQAEGGFALFTSLASSKLMGMNDLAQPLAGWPVRAGSPLARPTGGPALGDLNGDGTLEVVCGIEDGTVGAWHHDGSVVSGFPVSLGAAAVAAPVALADLDGDGAAEIIAATADGEVHVLGGDGAERPGWPVTVGADPVAPVVTRFSRGGGPVIVVAAGSAVEAFDGSGAVRFTTTLPGGVIQDPALGDLDGDGVDDIVLALDSNQIAVLDSTGAALPGTPIALRARPVSPPLVGALSPRGREVLVMEGQDLAVISLDGARHGGFPKPGGAGLAPTLADIDHDLATEVIAGTGRDSILYVYDAGDSSALAPFPGWPTPRGDFARTGSRDVGPPSPVRDLAVVATTDSSVRLAWSSPGNEGAGAAPVVFDLRLGRDTLTAAGFDTAQGHRIATLAAAGDPEL